MKKEKNETILVIACFLCNISQLPLLHGNKYIVFFYSLCWILLLIRLIGSNSFQVINYCVFTIAFDLYCLLFSIIKGGYISSDLFRPINLSTFILIIGVLVGKYYDEKMLFKLSLSYVVSSLIVAIYIYLDVFRGSNWAKSGGYLYASKNSAGQIFLTAVILVVFVYWKNHKILSSAITFFFIALIFMMKSRATIVTLILMSIYILLFVIKKPILKILGIIIILFFVNYILTDKSMYNLFINQIMLNNRKSTDISAVTSNRDIQIDYFRMHFSEHLYFGTGGTYIESMPLAVLMSYGLIGSVPVLLFSLYPAYRTIKYLNDKDLHDLCVITVVTFITMWLNGVFEEQAPFGPGVKCYFLWLLCGIMIGYKKEKLNDRFTKPDE